MKIFISMKMHSKSVDQVRKERDAVFEQIKSKLPEAELIDSIIDGADSSIAAKGDSIGIWYLGESLKLMSEADIIFFYGDWDTARGCRIEMRVAQAYGKYCVDMNRNELF